MVLLLIVLSETPGEQEHEQDHDHDDLILFVYLRAHSWFNTGKARLRGQPEGLTGSDWLSICFDVNCEANVLRHCDQMRRFQSQNATCREETVALLAVIRGGHNQVERRLRQTRALLGEDVGATDYLSRSSPHLATQKPVPLVSDDALSTKARPSSPVRLLVEEISSGEFLGFQGDWTDNRKEAKEFTTVLDLLHFAVEHLLTFPLGVFCAFPAREFDFSIALCSADFLAARQWDSRLAEMWLVMK